MNESLQKIAILRTVVGSRLTSVQFVMDYLILGFDEKGALTTLVWPELVQGEACLAYGTTGYRDTLCEIIGTAVSNVRVTDDEGVEIAFADGHQLRITFSISKLQGEKMIFTTPQHKLVVW